MPPLPSVDSTLARPRVSYGSLGVAAALLAAVLFAINGSASKAILHAGVTAQDLTILRALGACAGLVIVGAITGSGLRRFRITRRELPLLVTYGLAGFYAVPLFYFIAIARLPVGVALLLEFTAPVFVALWARFGQRRHVRPRLWAGLLLCVGGLAGVVEIWGELRLDPLGVAAGMGAAVLLASYFVLGARGVARRDSVSLTAWAFGIAGAAGLLIRAMGGEVPDWRALAGETASGTPVWLLCGYLLILGTIVPYLLVVNALRWLPPTSVGIIGTVEPVLAALVAWIALAETLTLAQLTGGAVVLAGVILAETARVSVRQDVNR